MAADVDVTRGLPWLLGGAAVLAQVAYPLTRHEDLPRLSVATVVLFSGAAVTHSWAHRGPRAAAGLVLAAGGTSLVAEAVGVATGVPFGRYAYTGSLGPQPLGVPLVVPLAWTMMTYPVLLAARALAGDGRLATALAGAAGLTAWDVFLDPQMVAAGHWAWANPTPALPTVPGIPLTNWLGWLVTGAVVTALADRAVPRTAADDRLPWLLLGWTWVGSSVGNAVFFRRPGVAATGAALLGAFVVPAFRRLRTSG